MNQLANPSPSLRASLFCLVLAGAYGCGADSDGGGGGGSGGGDGINAEAFIGTWRYQTGSVVTTCPGSPEVSVATTGGIESISRGTRADLALPLDGCSLHLDVSGNVAQAIAPATCTVETSVATVTVTINTYSLTLNDNDTLTEVASGTTRVASGAQTINCSAAISGLLERL